MSSYPKIARILQTVFNVKSGLSEDVSRRLYLRTVENSAFFDTLGDELRVAFSDTTLSWREMLLNSEYEVFDAQSEDEAREYARRILWAPLFDR
jgi:hypothetical protein